ncbi:hypothetical protein BACCIP111895_01955 [Neobacillus rhizosphaerae]|uniref:Yip1 domain-containing protein n=1 Tax=Neobacillus rhizosphaerae TaxID=2880965 RepID=A0ABM9EQ78_9BACI|nr:hypothetical protein [Neobacillus rhizosphaerae]CAH2714779.1 hypothetical protein BACCIP111895_01955 [Neobacillus rhizosphaerae]
MRKPKQELEANDIKYFYLKNRFHDLFFDTKKYKDLLWSKEALFSLLISISLTSLLSYLIFKNHDIEKINPVIPLLQVLLPAIIGGLFTLLGLIIGGLALITGTISEKVIYKINEENNIQDLISIIFNFYFSGAITGFTLVMGIFSFIITYIQMPFKWGLFIPISIILSYFIIFSLTYSVMLLGTCIRILLLRYHTLTKDPNNDVDKETNL